MIRDEIKAALVGAMKAQEKGRVAALRLIQAAIKNRDIEERGHGPVADDHAMVVDVLAKMAKQRRESIDLYRQGNRPDLVAAEEAELQVIEQFLPRQLEAAEAKSEIARLMQKAGAQSLRDMGAVMALVKEELAGRIDMKQASALVKAALAGE